MKPILPPLSRSLASAYLSCRSLRAALVIPLAAAVVALSLTALRAQTSAVPNFISYQGKVTNANGTLVGVSPNPVNRLVIFRIWNHASDSNAANLLYSEIQTVTILDGEFNALVGTGSPVTQNPLNYSEAGKSGIAVLTSATIWGGSAVRYLGVTIDDGNGTITTADTELTPRQQLVTSPYAFRAKYAEVIGNNGSSIITTNDAGKVGIGGAAPAAEDPYKLDVFGNLRIKGPGNNSIALTNAAGATLFEVGGAGGANAFSTDAKENDAVLRTGLPNAKLLLQTGAGGTGISINSANQVGIGTAAPGFPLDFERAFGDKISFYGHSGPHYGIGVQNGLLQIHSDAIGSGIAFGYGTSANLTEWMRIEAGGNVGIGTSNPTARLEVAGRAIVGALRAASSTTTHLQGAWLEWNKFGSSGATYLINHKGTGPGGIIFGSVNDNDTVTERMRLDDAGNLGIGLTNPAVMLDVSGTIRGAALAANTGRLFLNGGIIDANAAGDLAFSTTANNLVHTFLKSDGSLGLGVADPATKLHVAGRMTGNALNLTSGSSSHAQGLWLEWNKAGTGVSYLLNQKGTGSGGFIFGEVSTADLITQRMVIDGSGNVGIGTASPSAKLHVNGSLKATSLELDSEYSPTSVRVTSSASGSHSQGAHLEWNRDSTGATYLLNQKGVESRAGGIIFGEISYTNGTTLTERMRIAGNGNLGIGTTAPTQKLHVEGNSYVSGYVGIGTTDPKVPLEVKGAPNFSFNEQFYMNRDQVADLNGNTTRGVSIRAEGTILAPSFYVESDERTKRVIGRSSGSADLATLRQVEITDFSYRDTITHGSGRQKKVIAQQVERVFPQAVNISSSVVPDIFRSAKVAEGWVKLATDLKVGDRVQLIAGEKRETHEVLEVQAERFRTAFQPSSDNVFVYGREVKDFRTVDYDALSMLNISATQEIKREKDAEVAALREQNAALTTQVAALHQRLAEVTSSVAAFAAKDQARDAKLASIEKLLSSSQTVMARPAATPRANASGQE